MGRDSAGLPTVMQNFWKYLTEIFLTGYHLMKNFCSKHCTDVHGVIKVTLEMLH